MSDCDARALPTELTTPGMGRDAWRFYQRLSEPGAYLRVARGAKSVQVVALRGCAPRVLIEASPRAALQWRAAGHIEAVGRAPGVIYCALTPSGRRAAADLRPAPENDVRHEGIDCPPRAAAPRPRRVGADPANMTPAQRAAARRGAERKRPGRATPRDFALGARRAARAAEAAAT
ncbi:hypothetical protein SAMN05216200_11438 [Oceanicella actignis]|uniref:Uncharacterized protein n=1 Tax=Oceanicella actignis TaxID=1189325 RepID=A0A1M7U2C8_9RHOB|nr:hypothetical protein SAMN04488119_101384 [Oceanicella actignis]SHN77037.1 hypothetical protein SAMN05216200_11438 [Oceanicella actignis]